MATTASRSLAGFDFARDAFVEVLRAAPAPALAHRREREDYALGGLAVHVIQVLEHYSEVLEQMAETGAGAHLEAPAMPGPAPAVHSGFGACELEPRLAELAAAHDRLALLAETLAGRTVEVVYSPGGDPWPTSAEDVVGWVRGHYLEHVTHVVALAEEWRTLDVVERFNEAFGRHDVDAVMELMTPDVVFENTIPVPDGERLEGAERVRAFWTSFFESAPAASFTAEESFAAPDGRAVVRWRFDWDGGHVRGVDVMAVRDGRVAEKLSYVKG